MKGALPMICVVWLSATGSGCSQGRGHDPAAATSSDGVVSRADGGDSAGADASRVAAGEAGPVIEIPDDLPWSDPSAMALEVLQRCKGTDVTAVLALSTAVNRRHRITSVPGQMACESIFGADTWRTKAVQSWDGDIEGVRVRYEEAWALFHELPDGDAAVVVLKQEDDRWRFHDIDSPPLARFERWGAPALSSTSPRP